MKSFITILLLSSPILIYAQKCKLVKDETDSFSNEIRRESRDKLAQEAGNYFFLQLIRDGDNYSGVFELYVRGSADHVMPEGTPLSFKLANGKVIQFSSTAPSFGTSSLIPGTKVVETKYNVNFDSDKSTIVALSENAIEAARIQFDTELTYEVSKKLGANIQVSAQCLLK